MRVNGAFALVLIAVAAAIGPLPARADETVSIGGSRAVLLKPAAPRASVILMPGGDGQIAAGSGGAIGRLKGISSFVRARPTRRMASPCWSSMPMSI
jgi:hypothetical protein